MGILVHLHFQMASWEKVHFSIVALPFARQKEVWKPGNRGKPRSNGRVLGHGSPCFSWMHLNIPAESFRDFFDAQRFFLLRKKHEPAHFFAIHRLQIYKHKNRTVQTHGLSWKSTRNIMETHISCIQKSDAKSNFTTSKGETPRGKTMAASKHRPRPSTVWEFSSTSDLKIHSCQLCRVHGPTIPSPPSLLCHVHPLVLVLVVPAVWDSEKRCGALPQRWNVANGDDRRPHPTHAWRWGEGKLKPHGLKSWRLCNLAAEIKSKRCFGCFWKHPFFHEKPSVFDGKPSIFWWEIILEPSWAPCDESGFQPILG